MKYSIITLGLFCTVSMLSSGAWAGDVADRVRSSNGSVAMSLTNEAVTFMRTAPFLGAICQDCGDCALGKHWAERNWLDGVHQPADAHTTTDHDCESVQGHGSCDDYHPETCSPDFLADTGLEGSSVRGLVEIALSSTPEGLESLVERAPQALAINRDRSALQVFGCQGDVVLHLPLASLHGSG